jgi:hypothetical protein
MKDLDNHDQWMRIMDLASVANSAIDLGGDSF